MEVEAIEAVVDLIVVFNGCGGVAVCGGLENNRGAGGGFGKHEVELTCQRLGYSQEDFVVHDAGGDRFDGGDDQFSFD